MKILLSILFFCILQVYVHGWVALIKHNSTISPRHGYCFTDTYELGKLNKNEEKRVEGICAIAVCLENRDISLLGCGTARVEPPCYLKDGDLSKPYPDCCYELICPPDDNKL